MKNLAILLLLIPGSVLASLEIGSGYSSSHSGRVIPTLALALTSSNFALSGYSTGTRNDYYYHSAYGVHALRLNKTGALAGGPIVTGYGLGIFPIPVRPQENYS